MDTSVTVSVIAAASSVVVAAISFYLTKKKEREADWRKYEYEQYKEFMVSINGALGDPTHEGRMNFARACNTLHLIGSAGVISSLHALLDDLSINQGAFSVKHDALLSALVWEIRKDVEIPGTPDSSQFFVRLWALQPGLRQDAE